MCDTQRVAYKESKKNLMRSLITEFTNLYGKQNKTLRLEYMTRLWILEYNNVTYNVYTAKGKGTSIEVCGYTQKDIMLGKHDDTIIKFLAELYNTINE